MKLKEAKDTRNVYSGSAVASVPYFYIKCNEILLKRLVKD
jgi:hypothetical protein